MPHLGVFAEAQAFFRISHRNRESCAGLLYGGGMFVLRQLV